MSDATAATRRVTLTRGNIVVQLDDGRLHHIRHAGEQDLPAEVADHWIVRGYIDGSATPEPMVGTHEAAQLARLRDAEAAARARAEAAEARVAELERQRAAQEQANTLVRQRVAETASSAEARAAAEARMLASAQPAPTPRPGKK